MDLSSDTIGDKLIEVEKAVYSPVRHDELLGTGQVSESHRGYSCAVRIENLIWMNLQIFRSSFSERANIPSLSAERSRTSSHDSLSPKSESR
jgi:hypothetical protein